MSQFGSFIFATAMAGFAFAATGGFQATAQAIKAEEAAKAAEVAIPFVNHGGMRDWQAVGEDKIYIQDSQGKWYLATLAASAPDLPFATTIGFETKGNERLDRFGAVVISGQRYPLNSLVASAGPPPKAKK